MKLKMKEYAPIVLRFGLAAVFFWFGISQIIDPAYFRGYLPTFMFSLSYAHGIVIANGIVEIILAILLTLGYFTRIVAALLALHLLVITFEVGLFTETGARDFGLTMAMVAIALHGPDKWCLEKKKK